VIHPFRDGNGRMSRLITLWLLYVLGHDVGRFISLEKLIDDSKDSYYDTLGRSTAGCCSERLLGVIRSATSASMRALGARMFSIALDDSVLWIKATCRSVSRPAGL
jgi:Fic family protein